MSSTQIKLLDTQTGEMVSSGKPGEICVKGPQVTLSVYYNSEIGWCCAYFLKVKISHTDSYWFNLRDFLLFLID